MKVTDTSIHAYMNEVAPTLGARQITVAEVFEHAPNRDFSNARAKMLIYLLENKLITV